MSLERLKSLFLNVPISSRIAKFNAFRTNRRCRRRIAPATTSGTTSAIECLESKMLLSAVTAQFTPSQDTTIYAADPETSNGAGQFLVTGNGVRSLLKFDVASEIPAGSTVLDAVLTLHLGQASGHLVDVGVHPVDRAWGEGGSDAPGDETVGAAAAPFDATWRYAFFDGAEWDSFGADFGSVSASQSVAGAGSYEWFSQALIDDVQAWVDNSAANFGWLLESTGAAVQSFVSKDSPGGVLAPQLEVTYEPPPAPPQIVEGRLWNDANGDGRRSDPALKNLNLTISGGNSHFNAFGGEEYWFRSETDSRWYFLTEDGHLTLWTGFAGQLVGDLVTVLDPIYYMQPALLLQDNGAPESWLNGWTVELLDGDGNVVGTTVTAGRDLDGDGQVNDELEGGWYRFEAEAGDDYSVRQLVPEQWLEVVRIELERQSPIEKAVNSLGLYFRDSYHQNFGGQNEKWVFSDTSGWHFITPSGDLIRWNGRAVSEENPLTGTLVTTVGTAAWADPAIILDGRYDDGSSVEEGPLKRIDFGNQAQRTVQGRVWLDFFPNGERDEIQLAPDYLVFVPLQELQDGEEWFYDHHNADWYIIDADGHPRYFGPAEDEGADGPGADDGFRDVLAAEIEPWLNRRTVQLIDSVGNIVATTESRSIDWDQDGLINYETERGWYVFEDVPVGEYVVRTITDDDWQQTAPILDAQSDAIVLSRALNLSQTASDFLNWGGLNERWIQSASRQWYYILPNGDFYRWDNASGHGESQLSGNLVARLNSQMYTDLSLLISPDEAPVSIIVKTDEDPFELLFGNHRLLDSLLD